VLVLVQDEHAVHVGDRDDGPLEASLRPRCLGTVLRLDGVSVHVLAGEALDRRDQVRADPLRHDVVVVGCRGIVEERAAIGHHSDPRHRLDTPGQDQAVPARCHLLRREIHRLQPRSAEAVDLQPADGLGQAARDGDRLREVPALVTDRRNHTEDDVVDIGRIELGKPRAQLVDEPDHEVERLGGVERSPLALASRCADRLVDVGLVGHEVVPSRASRGAGAFTSDPRSIVFGGRTMGVPRPEEITHPWVEKGAGSPEGRRAATGRIRRGLWPAGRAVLSRRPHCPADPPRRS
jgi:hypothetical protein